MIVIAMAGFEVKNRSNFIAVAAQLMRQILVDYARAHKRQKRGGLQQKISLDETLVFSKGQYDELIALDRALTRLERQDPRQARIVELRFFGGLTVEETASVLQISPKTVKRDWSVARAWLHREISKGENP